MLERGGAWKGHKDSVPRVLDNVFASLCGERGRISLLRGRQVSSLLIILHYNAQSSFFGVGELQSSLSKFGVVESHQGISSLKLVFVLDECKVLRCQSHVPVL